ncbi:uncharacterized protein LOC110088108 isoform X1 [Pogona vitticeps]
MQADAEINIAEEASMKTKPVELEPADNGSDTESPTLNEVKRKRNASDQIMEATHKRPKYARSSGDNVPVRPRNMKGGKKQGEPENAGSTESDVSTGVFSVETKLPVDYLEKLKMIIRVISVAREWEKRLIQMMDSLPDVDVLWDCIKQMEQFSSANTPQIQTGLGSPELQPLPKGGKMKRGRPGQRFGKRGKKEQITGKLYWHKRAMKLLIRAKKLLSGRKRLSGPLPSSPAREPPAPQPELSTEELEPAIEESDEETPEPPTRQGVRRGPAAAEEISPDPEPSSEELEPEIEESDEETPEPPTRQGVRRGPAAAEEISPDPEPSSEELEPEIEESDEETPEPPTRQGVRRGPAAAEEISPDPEPSSEELEPEIEESDEETPEPPTRQGVRRGPAAAEEISPDPEPSSEELEPEIEESDEETPEPPTRQGVRRGPAAAEEISPEPEPSSEELDPEIEEIDEETPEVYAEVLKTWEWEQKKFGARHIGQEFRLVNLQNITSFAQAVTALHGAIQQVLDNVSQKIDAGDFVRMRFEGGDIGDPLFSVKLKGGLDADEFLSELGSLLQSDMELCADLSLRLVVTVVKPPRRGIPSRCLESTG